VLTGISTDDEAARALAAAHRLTEPATLAWIAALPCPYGDGTTGTQVAAVLADPASDALLALDEPDCTDGHRPWESVA
jgi:UDP-N-acetylglucosamine 2-epimerase (non-hydrolysing)